jgi:hypothetical protein
MKQVNNLMQEIGKNVIEGGEKIDMIESQIGKTSFHVDNAEK